MAAKNVHQDFYSSCEVELVRANVATARALLRTLIFALEAIEDGCISFDDDPGTGRWHNVLGAVCERLIVVRSALAEGISAPSVDWFTPLALAEALDAALWGVGSARHKQGLEGSEVSSAAQAVIDALDALMEDIQAARVAEAA